MNPQQANDRLRDAQRVRLASGRDRTVHAVATAGFGVLVGAFVVMDRIVEAGSPANGVIVGGYVVLLLALAAWQARTARTTPRHSRRIGHFGLAGTVVLMLAGIMTLNWRQSAAPAGTAEHWWVLLLVGVAIAFPMLLAGHLIHRRKG